MSKHLEKRITDWAKWYHYHKDSVGRSQDLKKTQEFYTTAIDGLLECVAIIAKDLQILEHGALQEKFQGLYLPRGVILDKEIRETQ